MSTLLSKGNTNAKLSKSKMESYILYLAPFNQNSKGINICPNASAGCIAGCLFTAGMGVFSNVIAARVKKTDYLLSDRKGFYAQLAKELCKLDKKGYPIAVRLNGTSDIDHLSMLKSFAGYNWQNAANIVFYDYTKVPQRLKKYVGTNYSLTFSLSETNKQDAVNALNMGFNVAAVFSGQLPDSFMGFPVVDGDKTDERFEDIKGSIIGLSAKGKAKKDTFGFVIR